MPSVDRLALVLVALVACARHPHRALLPGRTLRAAEVTAGAHHTCARFDNGRMRCWGDNAYGQLGTGAPGALGDTAAHLPAPDVDVGARVAQISAGDVHTCAVLEGGRLRCWGLGGGGALGYGDTRDRGADGTPASLHDVDVGGPVAQVSCGNGQTCALLAGGRVRCWGEAQWGVLGYGNDQNIGDDEPPSRVGDVPIGRAATAVVAGYNHTCAVLEGGGVRCWGSNASGQLGLDDVVSVGETDTPAAHGDVPLGAPARQLALGSNHTCALLDGGRVRCWGSNTAGALGRAESSADFDGRRVDVDLGGRATQIAARGEHTCALLETGRVRCWGSALGGQLGYGARPVTSPPASMGDLDVGGRVVQIAAGSQHTCAVLDTGAVRCWGAGAGGVLGYGNTNDIGDRGTPSAAGDVRVF